MEYLPPVKRKKRILPWVLVILLLLVIYTTLGNSTTPGKMRDYVQSNISSEVVRFDVYDQDTKTKIVIIRDEHDGRTALSFLKVPFMDRWTLKDTVSVPPKETRPITVEVDEGFRVLTEQVGFDRVEVLHVSNWNGSYARLICLLLFMVLAVVIHFWLEWRHRPKMDSMEE